MPVPQEKRYSFADILAGDESERVELVNGVPYMMAPPTREHQRILMELSYQLRAFLEGKECQVYPAPFGVRLFERGDDSPEDVDTMVEPDISVICDPDKLDEYGCKGAPNLVIEILSPSTQRHDRMVKYELYRRAGVREYWIVDPETKTVQVCVLENGQYYAPQVYTASAEVAVSVLEGCFIELEKVFRA